MSWKHFFYILWIVTFLGFIGSCSAGLYQEKENMNNVGFFLFCVSMLLAHMISDAEKDD